MRFSHTIVYVERVQDSLAFWQRAFGVRPGFVHESGDYGELDTGTTKLAFASHRLAATLFDGSYRETDAARRPIGFEVSFVVDDVQAAYERAVASGAEAFAAPVEHPWGQTVAYVRDGDGTIVALGSEMEGMP
ncbi:VOC family protein [Phycisphaera mikurensis]|uniref:VOC domain-containing protein n=1 Tax=Phycisphaera mikurensis (strain NBRC 102666 / KCTC 22515 / FYK2301M01) TaxID=1142394 RepID=I0IHI3_PHYMF|nr:VOC family protein [Phycisphaera mikurensis]MBB6440967.1 putative glyoxalase superfamily protein PhnB [Phycisphaera mikurensis]BAM04721.1 hypothetical protein PSMK_25620 [Phycisphaera mikurensis NBRC 102666]